MQWQILKMRYLRAYLMLPSSSSSPMQSLKHASTCSVSRTSPVKRIEQRQIFNIVSRFLDDIKVITYQGRARHGSIQRATWYHLHFCRTILDIQ